MNVTMPVELAEMVRERFPGLNVSGVLQRALGELVRCDHAPLACRTCGAHAQRDELVDAALSRFLEELMWDLREPVSRCATAEGAARVVLTLAKRWDVSAAKRVPLPRPTKAERARAGIERADVVVGAFSEPLERPRRRAAARKAAA